MRKLLIVLFLFLIPTVFAIEECQRVTDPADIPCSIISSWKPAGSCSNYNLSIYNSSGQNVQNTTWQSRPPTCEAIFNITAVGTYYYNSTIEDGVVNVDGGKMWLIAILLIPLGLSFFFIYWANSLEEEQAPMKWFMRLLSMLMIFVLFVGANIVINMNNNYAGLASLFNLEIFGWIFWTVLGVFLIYFIYRIFKAFQQKKSDDFEQGILR